MTEFEEFYGLEILAYQVLFIQKNLIARIKGQKFYMLSPDCECSTLEYAKAYAEREAAARKNILAARIRIVYSNGEWSEIEKVFRYQDDDIRGNIKPSPEWF